MQRASWWLFCCVGWRYDHRRSSSTYQTMLNTLDGVRDETGASLTSWAIWTRAWTAEENRHGDLLNRYLYLSGRVDMKQIEKTIQYLIGSGMVRSSFFISWNFFIINFNCFVAPARVWLLHIDKENRKYYVHAKGKPLWPFGAIPVMLSATELWLIMDTLFRMTLYIYT